MKQPLLITSVLLLSIMFGGCRTIRSIDNIHDSVRYSISVKDSVIFHIKDSVSVKDSIVPRFAEDGSTIAGYDHYHNTERWHNEKSHDIHTRSEIKYRDIYHNIYHTVTVTKEKKYTIFDKFSKFLTTVIIISLIIAILYFFLKNALR